MCFIGDLIAVLWVTTLTLAGATLPGPAMPVLILLITFFGAVSANEWRRDKSGKPSSSAAICEAADVGAFHIC